MSQHWDEQALTDYSLGELDKAQAAQLELHLADCPACRAEFNAIQDAIALLQADQWDAAPAPLTARAIEVFPLPPQPAGIAAILSGWLKPRGFHRQPWAVPALVGALATVAVLVFFGWRWLREPVESPVLIQVEVQQGTVELSTAGGSWQTVSEPIELKDNQRIRTRSGAEALITFPDLAEITLYADSELALLNSGDAASPPLLAQNRGRSLHQVRTRQTTPAYLVQVPIYVLAGNSGIFLVEIDETERRLTAVSGALQISAAADRKEIRPGQAYSYTDSSTGRFVPADPAILERFGGATATATTSPSATSTQTAPPSPTLRLTSSATPSPTASPSPLPAATPEPTTPPTQPPPATAIPTPIGDPEPTEEPEGTEEPEPTEDHDGTEEPEPTEDHDGTEEPEPTEDHDGTDEPEPTEDHDGTEEPEPTEDHDSADELDSIRESSQTLPAQTSSTHLRGK